MVRFLTLLFLLQKVAYVRTSSTTIESLGPLKLDSDPDSDSYFLFMHYFKSLLQKEITIHHKSNKKTTLNYINIKGEMCARTKGA